MLWRATGKFRIVPSQWRLQRGGTPPPLSDYCPPPPSCCSHSIRQLHYQTCCEDEMAVKIVKLLYVSTIIWVCTGFDDSDRGIGQWWEWNNNRHVRITNNRQTVTETNVMCILTRRCRSQRRSLMRRATDSVCRLSLDQSPTRFCH